MIFLCSSVVFQGYFAVFLRSFIAFAPLFRYFSWLCNGRTKAPLLLRDLRHLLTTCSSLARSERCSVMLPLPTGPAEQGEQAGSPD